MNEVIKLRGRNHRLSSSLSGSIVPVESDPRSGHCAPQAENHASWQNRCFHDLWKHLIAQKAIAISFTLRIRVRLRWRNETRQYPLVPQAVQLAQSICRQPRPVRNLDKWLWAISPSSRHLEQFNPILLTESYQASAARRANALCYRSQRNIFRLESFDGLVCNPQTCRRPSTLEQAHP